MSSQAKLDLALKRLLGYGLPVVSSGIGFVVLYNNFENGLMILILFLGLNLLFFFGARRFGADNFFSDALRFGSVCVITILVSLILLEVSFPFLLPTDYSQISSFIKGGRDEQVYKNFRPDFIFDQFSKGKLETNPGKEDVRSQTAWHKPGCVFDYFGYDPNRNIRYLNRVRWNRTGHFDHDYSVTKPEDVFRVVIIGDSYVESVQVPLDLTFHKIAEAALNKDQLAGNAKRFEVIALGNSGFGQGENIDVLRTQGTAYDPDLVILALCGNDFCDDDPELKRQLILTGGSVPPRVRRLAHHGYLALAFMTKRIEDLVRNRITISPELLQWSRDEIPSVERGWGRTLEYVKAARNLCEARGIAFLLLYLGSELEIQFELAPERTVSALRSMGGPHETINWDISKSMKRVIDYCEKFHIDLACLVGPLAEAQGRTGKAVFADHYSFFGHEVVARTLICFMKESTSLGKSIRDSIKTCFGP